MGRGKTVKIFLPGQSETLEEAKGWFDNYRFFGALSDLESALIPAVRRFGDITPERDRLGSRPLWRSAEVLPPSLVFSAVLCALENGGEFLSCTNWRPR